jgi:uncharacterized protein
VKFIADGMLGKLTRWLRILGQNVIYSIEFSDNKLLQLAKDEERILLTKDLELYKRAIARGLDAFYLEGKTEYKQLAEIAMRDGLKLEVDMDKSHCPICNNKLKSTQKELLKEELQKNTYTYYNKFWKCSNCGQIYWQGAHWKQIITTLAKAQDQLKKQDKNGA